MRSHRWNRREFLRTCAGGPGAAEALTPQAIERPNVVLVVIDDMGWMDLGCQGSPFYETPDIDRMAREGTRFTNAYANCPVCSPSRAALMTGRYPGRVGFTGHITATGRHRYPSNARILPPDDRLFLRSEEVTLAEVLSPAGYVSASIGKWHLGSRAYWPDKQGFAVNVAGYDQGSPPSYFYPYRNTRQQWNSAIPTLAGGEPGEYLTGRLTEEAIRFVEGCGEKPFFLYFPHYAVHTPLQAPAELVAKYEKKLAGDRPQKNAVYGAMVESVDRGIGRLRAAMARLGVLDRTLIVITSDNGGALVATSNAPLREGKGCLYEGGIRVPLIFRWPGRVRANATCDVPVMGADIYPTIVEMAGLRPPGVTLDGVSLRPFLESRPRAPGRDLFWYYPHYSPQYGRPGAAVRSGNLKLIETYDPPGTELFDLSSDLGEKRDLAAQFPGKTSELRARLHHHIASSVPIPHRLNDFAG